MPADPIRVQTVFHGAVNLASSEARKDHVDKACGDDRELQNRVEALIRAHDAPDSYLDEPLVQSATNTHIHDGDDLRGVDDLTFLKPSQRTDSLGRIGHYEVLEVLGRGGFGVVLRAFDEALQRVVAVKVLSPQIAVTSPARKRFLREARAAAQVRHDNVVQVHAVVEEPLPYLVMEFIPGETLQQRMDRTGPLSTQETVTIGKQIAAGLAAAHDQGLIHRDIKPTNILIDAASSLRVKITDFGLARAADDASLTKSGILAGTPMFMAPEQAKGDALDHRADLFSLGSVFYTMCSGRPPFRASGAMAVLKRVCDDEPRPIRATIPETPDWLCRIIEKLHAKDATRRYQSAAEVVEVLSDCEMQLAVQAEIRDFRRIPPKIRPMWASEKRVAERGRPRRTWNATVWSVFLVVVVFVAIGSVLSRMYISARSNEIKRAMDQESLRLQLEELRYRAPVDRRAGWIKLFNGKDLFNWVGGAPKGMWQTTGDGVLQLAGEGVFFTAADYEDFHLAAEVRLLGEADSGIFFRCDRRDLGFMRPAGYKAVINAIDKRDAHTGSLEDHDGIRFFAPDPQVQSDKWFTYEVVARGDALTIKLDGATTLQVKGNDALTPGAGSLKTDQPPAKPTPGAIGLQCPGKGRTIEFRNIWILPLQTSRPKVDEVEALRAKAAAVQKARDLVKARVAAGAPTFELMVAEAVAVSALIDVAAAERNQAEEVRLLQELLKFREEERRLTEQMIQAHIVHAAAINEIDAKIADVKAKLAKARAGRP